MTMNQVLIMRFDSSNNVFENKFSSTLFSSNLFYRFKGGGGGVKSTPKYTPTEMEYIDELAGYFKGKIGQRATPYRGKTFAGAPPEFGQAVSNYQTAGVPQQEVNAAISQGLSGEAAFKYDPQSVTSLWKESYATPMMQVWNDEVGADIEEQFAGGLYSTRAGQTVRREKAAFMGSNIAPALYNAQQLALEMGVASKERALDKQQGAIETAVTAPLRAFMSDLSVAEAIQKQQQAELNDAYTQFIRMSEEASPWAQMGLQAWSGMPATYDNIAKAPGQDNTADYMAAGAMALTALSDEKLKEKVIKIDNALGKLTQLQGQMFNFKTNPDKQLAGVIAQEVEKVFPQAVLDKEPNGEYKQIYTLALVGLIIEAVKELHSIVERII